MPSLTSIMKAIFAAAPRGRARSSRSAKSIDVSPAPTGFFTQHTNPRRNAERRLTKQMGHRQHRLLTKRLRRAEKEARWDDEAVAQQATSLFERPAD